MFLMILTHVKFMSVAGARSGGNCDPFMDRVVGANATSSRAEREWGWESLARMKISIMNDIFHLDALEMVVSNVKCV